MPATRQPSRHAPDGGARRASIAPGGSETLATQESGAMRVRLIVAAIARASLALVYAPLKLLPTRRKVVMISREHPTVPEDFTALRAALHRLDPTVEVVTLVKMVPPGVLGKLGYILHMFRQLFHVATARVLVIDTYAIVASVLTHKRELTIIQIWHALGAFKKFGLSALGQSEGRDERLARAMRMHQGYDIVLASGEAARAPFAEALGTPLARVRVAPLPRVDRLRDPDEARRVRARFFAAHPHLRGARIAVFAPTFRLDGSVGSNVHDLTTALAAEGVHTIVKLHPLMRADFGDDVGTAPGFSTQELLHVADLFITDYSSALFEAAVLGIPCYFLAPDLDDYLASRDFYLDYRADLPGPVAVTIPDLTRSVARAEGSREQSLAFSRHWVRVPDVVPTAGATPCSDAIAEIVKDAVEAPA